jgi:hypothetical protein
LNIDTNDEKSIEDEGHPCKYSSSSCLISDACAAHKICPALNSVWSLGPGYLVHRLFIVVYSVFSFVITVVVIAHIHMFVLFVCSVMYI